MSKQAIPQPQAKAFSVPAEDITIIGLDTSDGPEHPLFDRRVLKPLKPGFKENIAKYGQIQNCVLWKDGKSLIAVLGKSRIRAIREINKETGAGLFVLCTVRKGTLQQMYALLASENEQRQDDDILSKAEKIVHMQDVLHAPEDDIKLAFGISKATIKLYRSLLDLDETVLTAIRDGHIAATAAVKLVDLNRADQAAKLPELIASGNTSGPRIEEALRQEARAEAKASDGKPRERKKLEGKVLVRQRPARVRKLLRLAEREKLLSAEARGLLGWLIGTFDDTEIRRRVTGFGELLDKESSYGQKAKKEAASPAAK